MENIIFIVEIAILVVLYCLSACFSGGEAALITLGKLKTRKLIEKYPRKEKAFSVWLEHPNKIITTILIGNNTVNIFASALASLIAVRVAEIVHIGRGLTVSLTAVIVTITIIMFGEVTPKIFAIRNPEKISLLVIGPFVLLNKSISTFVGIFDRFARIIIKFFGGNPEKKNPTITEEEIKIAVQLGKDEGVLTDSEKKMIHSIFEFGDTVVKEVMVPRIDMICISINDSLDRILAVTVEEGFTRLPVYKDNLDNIIGILYVKDLLNLLRDKELIIIQDIIRQPYFVPENKKVTELLKEFKKGKLHMAIIVDEYGGTSGLVTLENLIEEIVGEIRDEYDLEESKLQFADDGAGVIEGKMSIDEIKEILHLDFPFTDDAGTIGGFIVNYLGRVPHIGEEIRINNFLITIINADRRKINQLKIIEQKDTRP